jgi:hypothetical protein
MPDVVRCPQCRKQVRVPEEYAGKRVKCPACPTTFTAPSPNRSGPEPVPAALADDDRLAGVRAVETGERDEDRRPARKRRPARARRRYDDDEDDYDDEDYRFRRVWPHRGGLVLALGIVSLVLSCGVILGLKLGVIALIVAGMDLRAMARGEMDRRGAGLTRAGMVCAIIGVSLSVLLGLLFAMVLIAAPRHK